MSKQIVLVSAFSVNRTVCRIARAAKVVIGSTPPLSPCGRPLPLMVKEKWVLDCITRLTRLDMADYITAGGSEP
jgi:hypothetical protein